MRILSFDLSGGSREAIRTEMPRYLEPTSSTGVLIGSHRFIKEVVKDLSPLHRALGAVPHGGCGWHLISRKGILSKEVDSESGTGLINNLLQLICIVAKLACIRVCCSGPFAAVFASCIAMSHLWWWRCKLRFLALLVPLNFLQLLRRLAFPSSFGKLMRYLINKNASAVTC